MCHALQAMRTLLLCMPDMHASVVLDAHEQLLDLLPSQAKDIVCPGTTQHANFSRGRQLYRRPAASCVLNGSTYAPHPDFTSERVFFLESDVEEASGMAASSSRSSSCCSQLPPPNSERTDRGQVVRVLQMRLKCVQHLVQRMCHPLVGG